MVVGMARILAMAGAVTLGTELALALLWRAPQQTEFDASGTFGPVRPEALRLAALGDSTLTAPGVLDADEIWVRVVAERLSQRLDRQVDLRSFGVGGATAADVVRDQLPAAIAFSPHVSLVSVGANDVIRGVPMRRFQRSLEVIVAELRREGSEVVLSGVGDLGTIPRLAPPLRQMVTRLGRRADYIHGDVARRHGASKADQWTWSAAEFRSRRDVWSADRFHPNAAGHQIWAQVCWEALDPLVSEAASLP